MNGPTHEIQPPREPVWRPARGTGAAETVMAQHGNEPDPRYLRLVDLAWDIRQMARQKGIAECLSQTIVIVGGKPRLWINGAIRIEADPRHGLDQARYRALRQIDMTQIDTAQIDTAQIDMAPIRDTRADDAQAAASEILLTDADRTTILDFVMARLMARLMACLMAQPGEPDLEIGGGL